MAEEKKYDLFISYSTNPDHNLSRKVESFLEGFHNAVKKENLHALQICRDGSDFELHKIVRNSETIENRRTYIEQILAGYLEKCTHLLVLCSHGSTLPTSYVNFEIDWFLKNKKDGRIFLARTEGENHQVESLSVFPSIVLENSFLIEFSFDFRGFKKESNSWQSVKNFDDELVSLAAQLYGRTAGDLLPIYSRENENRLKVEKAKLIRQRLYLAIAFAIALIAATIAYSSKIHADIASEKAVKNLKSYQLKRLDELIDDARVFNLSVDTTNLLNKRQALDSALKIVNYKYNKDDTDFIQRKKLLEGFK